MSKFAALAGGQTGMIAAGAVVVAGVIGGGALLMRQGEDPAPQTVPATEAAVVPQTPAAVPEPTAPEPAVAEPQTTQTTDPDTTPAPVTPDPEPAATDTPEPEIAGAVPDIVPPGFDEVRTESDGLTVIAGKAAPGTEVALLVDGKEVTRVTAEGNGTFAAIALLDSSAAARVLTLVQIDGDTKLMSEDEIILAPTPQPEPQPEPVVVAAAPEATAEPEPQPQNQPETQNRPETQSQTGATTTEQAEEPSEAETVPAATAQSTQPVQTVAEATSPEPAAAEPAEVAVLRSDSEGVEVINRSAAPEVMSNVEIDTISYSDVGDVLLSGRAQAQAQVVRVYLNNAPVTTLEVDAAGRWRGDLPDVDTGVYTLRVDELDEGGAVTSRVETPFKREDPDVLVQAQTDDIAPVRAITVQTGATLWAIARDRYGDGTLYVRVVEANSDAIKDPDLIYPGQIFELPQDP